MLLAQLRVAGVKIVAASSHTADLASAGAETAPDLREAVAIFIGNEGAVGAGDRTCRGCAGFDSDERDGGEFECWGGGFGGFVRGGAAEERHHHR